MNCDRESGSVHQLEVWDFGLVKGTWPAFQSCCEEVAFMVCQTVEGCHFLACFRDRAQVPDIH